MKEKELAKTLRQVRDIRLEGLLRCFRQINDDRISPDASSYDLKRSFERVYSYIEEREPLFFKEVLRIGYVEFSFNVRTASAIVKKSEDRVSELQFLFNPRFYASITYPERAFVTCHETLHFFLEHPERCQAFADRELANIAADIIVNDILLEKTKINVMPRGVTGKSVLGYSSVGMSLEEVYKILESQVIEHVEELFKLLLGDHDFWRVIVVAASEDGTTLTSIRSLEGTENDSFEAKMQRGQRQTDKPGRAEARNEHCVQTTRLTTYWEKFLTENADKEHESWLPNRKCYSYYPKIVLPSIRIIEEEKKDLLIALDRSGSVKPQEINLFASLIQDIPHQKWNATFVLFNTSVVQMKKEEILGKTIKIGGGTSFEALSKWVGEMKKYPSQIFVLTDGDGGSANVPRKFMDRWHWVISRDPVRCQAGFGQVMSINKLMFR